MILLGALVMAFQGHSSAVQRDQPGCYPNNEYTIRERNINQTGTGQMVEKGQSTAPASGEYEPTGSSTNPANRNVTAQSVKWDVAAQISGNATSGKSPGSMEGHLNASVLWSDGLSSKFSSRCIAEAGIESEGTFEVEFEGTLTQWPVQGSERNVPAVMTLSGGGTQPSGELKFHIGVDGGTTCFERGNPEFGIKGTGRGTLSVSASSPEAHRAGFPPGKSPGNCPQ
jgi:hypothetical protein